MCYVLNNKIYNFMFIVIPNFSWLLFVLVLLKPKDAKRQLLNLFRMVKLLNVHMFL
jgi:hypothetical protein